MKSTPFGKLLKSLREERRLSLRKFCQITDLDPGNVSRWERGVTAPPQNKETLNKISTVFGIKPESDRYKELFFSASISAGRLPSETLDNEALLSKMPLLLRTLDGRKLSEEQFEALINKIKAEI